MPSQRRDGREAALQFLFSHELNSVDDLNAALTSCWDLRKIGRGSRAFAEQLVRGLAERRDEVDQILIEALENYQLNRLSAVDRNLLRLAVHELLFVDGTPDPVVLNEAIEIAKRFGGSDSARFVNGVLDRICREHTGSNSPQPESPVQPTPEQGPL